MKTLITHHFYEDECSIALQAFNILKTKTKEGLVLNSEGKPLTEDSEELIEFLKTDMAIWI